MEEDARKNLILWDELRQRIKELERDCKSQIEMVDEFYRLTNEALDHEV